MINDELDQLAHLSFRRGIGATGFRSAWFDSPDAPYWVKIDLDKSYLIDQVVLVPVLWRSRQGKGVIADAFPVGFRVRVGEGEDSEGVVVAEFTEADNLLPRAAPLVVSFPETSASWVKIETTQMSQQIESGRYMLQVSEILVFQGAENVALRRPVSVSRSKSFRGLVHFHWRQLTDGSMPYIMDSAEEKGRYPFVSPEGQQPNIYIDLGEAQEITRIRLHSVEEANYVPQSITGDLGMPRRLFIIGANNSDFSDEKILLNYGWSSLDRISPIMEWRINPATCRYIRLGGVNPRISAELAALKRFGFAEVEMFSGEQNVSLGKEVSVADYRNQKRHQTWLIGKPSALTDGHNLFGKILSGRDWVNQLGRRHELERELALLTRVLEEKYGKQKQRLEWMTLLILALLFLIALVIIFAYRMRIRNEIRVRERIGANLHDELGTNLHAIRILGELAVDSVDDKKELLDTLERIRGLTERTGLAANRCASMMRTEEVNSSLVSQIREEADRMLRDVQYEVTLQGEDVLNKLRRRTRVDFFLFFKECLANVIRHSRASLVKISVAADRRQVQLVVEDDGIGLKGARPKALLRRAKLLKGDLRFQTSDTSKGLRVEMKFKLPAARI